MRGLKESYACPYARLYVNHCLLRVFELSINKRAKYRGHRVPTHVRVLYIRGHSDTARGCVFYGSKNFNLRYRVVQVFPILETVNATLLCTVGYKMFANRTYIAACIRTFRNCDVYYLLWRPVSVQNVEIHWEKKGVKNGQLIAIGRVLKCYRIDK